GSRKTRRVAMHRPGRYNQTIRVEHAFNHLRKMEGHQGWEWVETFQSVADQILQPTLKPRRGDVKPFLFHGYDPGGVVQPFNPTAKATRRSSTKKYGVAYVGHNWQRRSQMRRFLEAIAPIRQRLRTIAPGATHGPRRPA